MSKKTNAIALAVVLVGAIIFLGYDFFQKTCRKTDEIEICSSETLEAIEASETAEANEGEAELPDDFSFRSAVIKESFVDNKEKKRCL